MNPNSIPPAQVQKIRDQAIRQIVEWLTRSTHSPAVIGQRAMVLAHCLTQQQMRARNLHLATKLGVTESRASQCVVAAEEALYSIRNFTDLSLNGATSKTGYDEKQNI